MAARRVCLTVNVAHLETVMTLDCISRACGYKVALRTSGCLGTYATVMIIWTLTGMRGYCYKKLNKKWFKICCQATGVTERLQATESRFNWVNFAYTVTRRALKSRHALSIKGQTIYSIQKLFFGLTRLHFIFLAKENHPTACTDQIIFLFRQTLT